MRLVSILALSAAAALPLTARAQTELYPSRPGVFQTFIEGLLAGAGLGIAYINPYGEGWLLSDEDALPAATATGLAAAFVTRALSSGQHPDEARRPRFSATIGRSDKTSFDYALGMRVPVASHVDVQGVIVTASHSWERTERQTRCDPFFGCITGDYVVDQRHEQSVSAIIGGVIVPKIGTSIALGAGPVSTVVELQDTGRSRRSGFIADAMLGLESGARSHWTMQVGARVVRGTAVDGTSLQVRLGRAFGY